MWAKRRNLDCKSTFFDASGTFVPSYRLYWEIDLQNQIFCFDIGTKKRRKICGASGRCVWNAVN
ncbi:hypothetical protein BVC71_02140 [Marivivens niveibacter]|uniref:Uncharacterized protein n=1 Tax=Marivivens niveibacter TaxID=1930667 RepID=A0A251X179_9RHOB|nr:hypothetical protein BVC71_02140 [Marivivens niveibacter]